MVGRKGEMVVGMNGKVEGGVRKGGDSVMSIVDGVDKGRRMERMNVNVVVVGGVRVEEEFGCRWVMRRKLEGVV